VTTVPDDLEARGLIHDTTDREALAARLAEGPITLYCGFDPSSDSLHLGNLFPLLLLRRFQDAGHRPIALAGGATGMVGDPSGRSDERTLLDEATLRANTDAIKLQLARFVDFDAGDRSARLVDNLDWTGGVTLLDFLREVGKHATVNQMLAKESVRSRLEGEAGISYTEFSYMLLQANDYWWLHRELGCELQVGGSDQWGNITAGIDLIRRRSAATVHGLTVPLLTRADGGKFGKSQEGNIWLDGRRTSPYRMYQYLVQAEDRDVETLLLRLTLLPVEEIRALVAEHGEAPERRVAQRALARSVTGLVHGPQAAAGAEQASVALFGGSLDDLDESGYEALAAEVPLTEVEPGEVDAGLDVVDLLCRTELASSKSDARRVLAQGGVSVAGRVVGEDPPPVGPEDFAAGRHLLLRRGKSTYHLLRIRG
jgi:tyrosyl-tRNA synthetase